MSPSRTAQRSNDSKAKESYTIYPLFVICGKSPRNLTQTTTLFDANQAVI